MKNIAELEKEGLFDALNVEEKDLFESKYNLLGFFKVLYKIDKRIKKNKQLNTLSSNQK